MAEPVIAIVNTSEEVSELLKEVLQEEGFPRVVIRFIVNFKKGLDDFGSFLRSYNPIVIIYDIAIPYRENWDYFQKLRNEEEARGRSFLLTTTNKAALEGFVGPTETLEIVGKPFDLQALIASVRRALERS
jgi:DNA-binding response OmpR family regulator